MEKCFELTEQGDSERTFFVSGGAKGDCIVHSGYDDDVLRANAEGRKEDGFDVTRRFRRVAHIDLGTVRVLADVRKDADARAYLDEHDTAARDRMIRRYPDLFQACSGGV